MVEEVSSPQHLLSFSSDNALRATSNTHGQVCKEKIDALNMCLVGYGFNLPAAK